MLPRVGRSFTWLRHQHSWIQYTHFGILTGHKFVTVHIADAVNAKAITLDDAARGYAEFDAGAATKYVLNPNGYIAA